MHSFNKLHSVIYPTNLMERRTCGLKREYTSICQNSDLRDDNESPDLHFFWAKLLKRSKEGIIWEPHRCLYFPKVWGTDIGQWSLWSPLEQRLHIPENGRKLLNNDVKYTFLCKSPKSVTIDKRKRGGLQHKHTRFLKYMKRHALFLCICTHVNVPTHIITTNKMAPYWSMKDYWVLSG